MKKMDYPIDTQAASRLIETVGRDTMRAELARRMGWAEIVFTCSPPIGIPPGEQDFAIIPDPFIDADDNRALVTWLAADDEQWKYFYAWFTEELGLHTESDNPIAVVRDVMTAEPSVIARTACKALGITEK